MYDTFFVGLIGGAFAIAAVALLLSIRDIRAFDRTYGSGRSQRRLK